MSAWSDREVSDAMELLSCCASDWASSVDPDIRSCAGDCQLAWSAFCHALYQPWIDHDLGDLTNAHCYAEAQALLACGWRPERRR